MVLVETKNGPVRGRERITADQIKYCSFQAVPYAQPPVGELRFKSPLPIASWSTPLDATQPAPVALCLDFATRQFDERSSEDCLYLNIYTRNIRPAAARPVMLYIHGGGFMAGSPEEAMYSPEFLLRRNVVFVSIAYRLGAFGFLSVADPSVGIPGNAGLKDQALAMRWVRDNIAAFGGDPHNITVFGESAGAGSVHYHMLSDYSRGLFQRAILQSGTAFSVWAQQPKRDLTAQLARKLGWSGEGGVAAMMRVLCAADAREITGAQYMDDAVDRQRGQFFLFVPVVEPYGADCADCFLPKGPQELAPNAWGNAIPAIIGCTAQEAYSFLGGYKQNPGMFDDIDTYLHMLPWQADGLSTEKRLRLADVLKAAYYGDDQPSLRNRTIFADLQSDKFFWLGAVEAIRARLTAGTSAPTFLFRFSYDSPHQGFAPVKMMCCGEKVKGAIHGEDLQYLFRMEMVDYDEVPADSAELGLIEKMVAIWTGFAATGNPNCEQIGLEWLAAEGDGRKPEGGFQCLDIGERMELIELPETGRLRVWEELAEMSENK